MNEYLIELMIDTSLINDNWKNNIRCNLTKIKINEENIKEFYMHKLVSNLYYYCEKYNMFGIFEDSALRLLNKYMGVYKTRRAQQENAKIELESLFKKYKIEYVYLKGEVLENYIYHREKGIRISSDIDILLSRDNAKKAYDLIKKELGYDVIANEDEEKGYSIFFQHLAPLRRGEVYLELHFRLNQFFDSYSISTSKIITRRNANITSLEDTIVSLCYHIYQHEYRESRYILRSHADLFNLMYYKEKEINWMRLLEIVKEENILFPVLYALYTTDCLYSNVKYYKIPLEIWNKYIDDNFLRQVDGIESRHLFDNTPLSYWSVGYLERFFMNVWDLRREIAKEFFLKETERRWRKMCSEYDIEYDNIYEFTTKIWRDTGF